MTVYSKFATIVDKVSLKLCLYKGLIAKTPTPSEINALDYVQQHSVSVDMPSILRPAQLTHPLPVTVTATADGPFFARAFNFAGEPTNLGLKDEHLSPVHSEDKSHTPAAQG